MFLLLTSLIIIGTVLYYLKKLLLIDRREQLVDQFPGPKKYPFVGTTLPFLFLKRDEFFDYFRNMVNEYKSPFRSWFGSRPVVHLSDPHHIELVLNKTIHIEKGRNYDHVRPWLGEGLLTSTGNRWFTHRKLLTPTFHFKILETFMEVFVEKSEKLVEILKEKLDGKEFNIFTYITVCTLDIITKTAMGTEINAMSNKSNRYVTALYGLCEMTVNQINKPWLHNDFIFGLTKYGRYFKKCLAVLHDTTNGVIDERQRILKKRKNTAEDRNDDDIGKKKRLAFLDLLLEISKDGTVLTKEQIREEVDTFMFEGHDTTTASICWTIFLLALHPEIQEKTYNEIISVSPPGKSITFNELNELKLLERVIKESLRLYPSVGTISRIAKRDIEIDGYVIPEGCGINIQIIDLHRNPKYYEEPNKFDPDRFLPENTKNRHPYAFIPFSAGPRNCIGQRFALAEEKTLLFYLLKSYKFRCSQDVVTIKPTLEIILRPYDGLYVTIEKR